MRFPVKMPNDSWGYSSFYQHFLLVRLRSQCLFKGTSGLITFVMAIFSLIDSGGTCYETNLSLSLCNSPPKYHLLRAYCCCFSSVGQNDLMKHISDKTNNYIYSDKLLLQLFSTLMNLSLLCIWKVEHKFLPRVFLFPLANPYPQRIKSLSAGLFLLLRTMTAVLIQPA